MAVFRVEKTKDFTIMSNHHLRNTELSLKAKGLLSLMLSLPEDWDYTTKGLAHICKDGVDSITTALKELERHGYLTRQRLRYDNGQLGDIEYTIHDELDLDMLGDERTALFLIMSDTDGTFAFLISLIYSILFNRLCERADDVYSGPLGTSAP